MKIGIFAYGRAGCKIAEKFKRFEVRTMNHVSEFIMAADTSSSQLYKLDRIDEEWQVLYGRHQFDGRGTGGDLEPAVDAAKETHKNVAHVAKNADTDEIDAFVVMGSLGGGTGGGGAPRCAKTLSQRYNGIPVYGVGILPSRHEPDLYTLNAARTVQAFSRETDNLLLFDNDHLGVGIPEYHPAFDDDADPDDVFLTVNQDIARCLHLLFTADEQREPSHLQGSTLTTEDIIEVLSAGGLSTMSYVTETLPRPARPGIRGRLWELLEYFRTTHEHRKLNQQQEYADGSQNSENNQPNNHQRTPFTDPLSLSLGTGPNAPVENEENGTLFTKSGSVETTNLPVLHEEEMGHETASAEQPGNSDSSHKPKDIEDLLERNWPHPTKLTPLTLDPEPAMMPVNPAHTARSLYLLIAPKHHLTAQHAIATADWADEHTNAGMAKAANYPSKHKKVGVLTVCSGIGIPKRIQNMQSTASETAQRILQKQQTKADPKEFNVFENEKTVPPSF